MESKYVTNSSGRTIPEKDLPGSGKLPRLCLVLFTVLFLSGYAGAENAKTALLADYLRARGQAPADYVLSKFNDHRIVLLGEHHWVKHDALLVKDLVPRLAGAGVAILAMETLPASEQKAIDRLITAKEWDYPAALAVFRKSGWPYKEYVDILHAAWETNNSTASARITVLALGPGSDWRDKLLPQGRTYDSFMADLVFSQAGEKNKILIYCGIHHAFTRYNQPEFPRAEKVERYLERMGNRLWRNLGDDVFLIALHRPWVRSAAGKETKIYPVKGAVDCAAAGLNKPVGFDVVGSPFAELGPGEGTYYAMGHPGFRFQLFTDGYLWQKPLGDYEGTTLIPLGEFAPDKESFAEVIAANPFSDEETTLQELEILWEKESGKLRHFPSGFGWTGLLAEDPCAGRK